MLIYHHAFDIYSSVFRILQLLLNSNQEEVEVARMRIWDFYLTFPSEVKNISFPQQLSSLKREFKRNSPNPYEELIDPKRMIDRMKPFQLSAMKCIASYGFIDPKLLAKGIVKRTSKEIPDELRSKLVELSQEKKEIVKLISTLSYLPFNRKNGLKDRTGLMEYRYDQQ